MQIVLNVRGEATCSELKGILVKLQQDVHFCSVFDSCVIAEIGNPYPDSPPWIKFNKINESIPSSRDCDCGPSYSNSFERDILDRLSPVLPPNQSLFEETFVKNEEYSQICYCHLPICSTFNGNDRIDVEQSMMNSGCCEKKAEEEEHSVKVEDCSNSEEYPLLSISQLEDNPLWRRDVELDRNIIGELSFRHIRVKEEVIEREEGTIEKECMKTTVEQTDSVCGQKEITVESFPDSESFYSCDNEEMSRETNSIEGEKENVDWMIQEREEEKDEEREDEEGHLDRERKERLDDGEREDCRVDEERLDDGEREDCRVDEEKQDDGEREEQHENNEESMEQQEEKGEGEKSDTIVEQCEDVSDECERENEENEESVDRGESEEMKKCLVDIENRGVEGEEMAREETVKIKAEEEYEDDERMMEEYGDDSKMEEDSDYEEEGNNGKRKISILARNWLYYCRICSKKKNGGMWNMWRKRRNVSHAVAHLCSSHVHIQPPIWRCSHCEFGTNSRMKISVHLKNSHPKRDAIPGKNFVEFWHPECINLLNSTAIRAFPLATKTIARALEQKNM